MNTPDELPDTGPIQLLARVGEALGSPAVLVRPLSGSIVNVVHAVRCGERELIVKFGAAEGIRREAAVLTLLRQTEVPIPHAVLLPANPTFPNDLLLIDVLPGHAAELDSGVLTDAGRKLRRVHEVELPGFGLVGTDHERVAAASGTWFGFLDAVVAAARQLIPVNVMPTAVHDEVAAQLRQHRTRAHLTGVGQGVLLHGDLMPKHVWDDQGRLVGLIDWGDAMAGDPLFDLARFSMAGDDAFRQFLQGYGSPNPPDAHVLALYRMVWSLMALTVECGAGGDWVDGYLSTVRRELGFLRQLVDQG
ncbi:aminoglycoside phosphotransferase family protein [Streptomyces sp. KM273126]|uniref:phosphotransferase family protein n=1 Tax=Streptomyces sp. KM273126 TaxID=2545247 RepID=UPI001404948A|nr:aminoglycoside phosphotransferase family protein [Streptomyces sp. KM273126]MBA2813627.1 aminoglycoside phosphotransferase family protein [Streptomyces sp. KM273126]